MCEQSPDSVLDGTPTRDAWWPGARASRGLLALTLVSVLAHVPRADAYPIAPVTLWSLTQEAELIVWADVEQLRIAPRERGEDDGMPLDSGEIATLRVRESASRCISPRTSSARHRLRTEPGARSSRSWPRETVDGGPWACPTELAIRRTPRMSMRIGGW